MLLEFRARVRRRSSSSLLLLSLAVCRDGANAWRLYACCGQVLVPLLRTSSTVTRGAARQQIAHYTRATPSDTKVANAIKIAKVIAHGDPTRDLQSLESLAAHCKEAGHHLRVFRMSGAEAKETLMDKAKAQYEQEARAAAKKAFETERQPSPHPPFNEVEYRARCASVLVLLMLDARAGC